MRDHVLLYINGRPVRVGGEDVFLTLAEFLRRRRGLVGTKVVCAEGDCGSCAVLVGRVNGDGLKYAAVTSCIQLVLQLDACHVVTVEGLRDGDELNAIQESMVACQGTQCGFCTPGFVVSMYDLMRDGRPCDAGAIRRGLVGNLCRCTGYDSIVRAALAADRSRLKDVDALYPPGPLMSVLALAAKEEVRVEAGHAGGPRRVFFKPTSVESAVRFRAEHPAATVVSGATDVGVLHGKRLQVVYEAMTTAGLSELRGARVEGGEMVVGAAATLSELERLCGECLPELAEHLAWFGSPLIKNSATLAGNLVTGSPIGDTAPAMIALGAAVEIAGTDGRREVAMDDFYAGYRQTVLRPGELVTRVRIPLPAAGEVFKLYKISRRKDMDISGFSAAVWIKLDGRRRVRDVRIAFGGVGPTTLRMTAAEDLLRGEKPTREAFEAAAEAARGAVTPITDVRGSAEYRRLLAGNILLKFWHDSFGGGGGDDRRTHGPDGSPSRRRSRFRRELVTA